MNKTPASTAVIELSAMAPSWTDEERQGFTVRAQCFLSLDHPSAFPDGPQTDLFLEIEEDLDAIEFRWTVSISEEDAGFGPSEYGCGCSGDLEGAKRDCWLSAIDFLQGEGYCDDEIATSV
jgi:hypothetical protein